MGGRLRDCTEDDQKRSLEKLLLKKAILVDLHNDFAVFYDCRAHEDEDYVGESFSIMHFTATGWEKAPGEVRAALHKIGRGEGRVEVQALQAVEALERLTRERLRRGVVGDGRVSERDAVEVLQRPLLVHVKDGAPSAT